MIGCGSNIFEGAADSDTTGAKIEEARIAMDSGNYGKAVNLLRPMLDKDGDGVVGQNDVDTFSDEEIELGVDLASAYLGKAGVDVITFLNSAANIQAKTVFDSGIQVAISKILESAQLLIPPAFAQTSGTDCLNDPEYKVISDALPVLDTANMDDLELGIALLDALKGYITTNIDFIEIEKNIELLRAVGYFTRLFMDIILVTDTNGNNIPDNIDTSTITPTIAQRVDESFEIALQAILASGILGTLDDGTEVTDFNENDLSKAINDLKNTINTDNDDTISNTELVTYLEGLVSECVST